MISSYETSLGGPLLRDRAWFFAAAGDTTTNQAAPLAGGDVIDSSAEADSLIGKVASMCRAATTPASPPSTAR